MEFNVKLSFDSMNFSSACIDSYTAIIQKEGLEINNLKDLMEVLYEESYSIEKIRLLGNNKIQIEGNIEDGIAIVDDIFSIVEAVKIEKDLLDTKLQQCGFYDSDIKLVISKLC